MPAKSPQKARKARKKPAKFRKSLQKVCKIPQKSAKIPQKFNEEDLKVKGLNPRQTKAILYIKDKGRITNSKCQTLNSVSKRTATNDLSELEDKYNFSRLRQLFGNSEQPDFHRGHCPQNVLNVFTYIGFARLI